MPSFSKVDFYNFCLRIEDVKSKVTAEVASEAFSSADTDDKTAGGSYFADRAADKKRT